MTFTSLIDPDTAKKLSESKRLSRRNALALGGIAGALASFNEMKTTYDTVRDRWNIYKTRGYLTVELSDEDHLYDDAVEWVQSLLPAHDRTNLAVRSVNNVASDDDYITSFYTPATRGGRGRSGPTHRLVAEGTKGTIHHIVLEGHEIDVSLTEPPGATMSENGGFIFAPHKLWFSCKTQEAQEAVLRGLEQVLARRQSANRRPDIKILDTKWNQWSHRGDLPPRPLSSVVLRGGQLERITEDLERFLDSEDKYTSRALPWHRGYLFEGPPGTGKTSLARALASHFGMDLWYAPLGDVKDDSALLGLLGQVYPRSMVLLEDVDVFAATRERHANEKSHVTLSGLLNALDGVATPHGLVTVMTTNKPDGLDEALTRAGRMDVVETLKLPDIDQATRLYESFYQVEAPGKIDPIGQSTADLLEIFKTYMDDAEGGYIAVVGEA